MSRNVSPWKPSKREARRLWQMFAEARDSHAALIDCHRTGYKNRRVGKGISVERCWPKEYRGLVARLRRDVAAWEKVVRRLTGREKGE